MEPLIEKGVLVHSKRKESKYGYLPFNKMVVDDSFFIDTLPGHKQSLLPSLIRANAKSFNKRNNLNWIFKVVQERTGVRVWRIK